MGSSQISLQLSCRKQTQKTTASVGRSESSPSPAGFLILGKSWRVLSCPHPHCCGVPFFVCCHYPASSAGCELFRRPRALHLLVLSTNPTHNHWAFNKYLLNKKKSAFCFFPPNSNFIRKKQVTYIQYRWTDQSPEKRGCRQHIFIVNEEAVTGFGARRAPWDEVIGWWLGLRQEGLVLGTTLQMAPYMVISIYSILMSHFKSQNSCETKTPLFLIMGLLFLTFLAWF